MATNAQARRRARGQAIVIFVLAMPVLLVMVGLALDGGYSFAQRRSAQNAADMAALAGARVMTAFVSGSSEGTDANVKSSIDQTIAANGGVLPAYTDGPDDPRYIDISGSVLGWVGHGSIPGTAAGVRVGTSKSWKPFFAGALAAVQLPIGDTWTANAVATARGGYRAGGPPAGNLLPIGVSEATYNNSPICPLGTPDADCTLVHLTPGELNIPGGFGWLSFGCGDSIDDNGNPYDLGQNNLGCRTDKPFLEGQWGNLGATPPIPPNSYGCCSEVGLPGSGDDIGSLPGNKAAVDDDTPGVAYYIDNGLVGFVPIWDYAFGNGNPDHAGYHIIGYAGFQLVHVDGAKNIQGYLRQVIFNGPVTTTSPGFAGAPLAIQLIQ